MTTAIVHNVVDSSVIWGMTEAAKQCDNSSDRPCIIPIQPRDLRTLAAPNLALAARATTPSSAEKHQNGLSDTVTIVVLLVICATTLTVMGTVASNLYSSMLQFSTFDIVRMLGI